jgi:hypothetical protein
VDTGVDVTIDVVSAEEFAAFTQSLANRAFDVVQGARPLTDLSLLFAEMRTYAAGEST